MRLLLAQENRESFSPKPDLHFKSGRANPPQAGFSQKVYEITSRIPKGRVSTYAAIAFAIGRPGAARAVGNALNKNPYKKIPCHRVVRRDGYVGGYAHGTDKKIEKLLKEGVLIQNRTINLSQLNFSL